MLAAQNLGNLATTWNLIRWSKNSPPDNLYHCIYHLIINIKGILGVKFTLHWSSIHGLNWPEVLWRFISQDVTSFEDIQVFVLGLICQLFSSFFFFFFFFSIWLAFPMQPLTFKRLYKLSVWQSFGSYFILRTLILFKNLKNYNRGWKYSAEAGLVKREGGWHFCYLIFSRFIIFTFRN